MNVSLALIGLAGGVITGLSPCILPVLPVIFLAGGARRRPYEVVAGLVTSFTLLTLVGTAALAALPIPPGAVRWAALAALVLVGLGLIIPRLEAILEAPFARFAPATSGADRGGFTLGLILGAVYVPCAGPVLAAITVAGATGNIGSGTVALTLGFAAGTAATLLVFALAGRAVAERVAAFRKRQRGIRIAAGLAVIGLAFTLTFDLTGGIQRAIPDYTAALGRLLPHASQSSGATPALAACVGRALYDGSAESDTCGPAPAFTGVTEWLNTPGGTPVAAAGKVTLVDFWTFDCINCRHVLPHVNDWYARYRDQGLQVVGVHTPEYGFEHDLGSVAEAVQRLGVRYPVAVDNDYKNWSAYGVQAWPTTFLLDATGQVRAIQVGEGGYDETEKLIRTLLGAP